jgi:hypothetical protein
VFCLVQGRAHWSPLHVVSCRPRADEAGDAKSNAVDPVAFVSRIVRVATFAVFFACCGVGTSRAQVSDAEKGVYARAVQYCRGTVRRPMTLDLDRRVLCFDGAIVDGLDLSIAKELGDGGLFVVRSFGGSAIPAVVLGNLRSLFMTSASPPAPPISSSRRRQPSW